MNTKIKVSLLDWILVLMLLGAQLIQKLFRLETK